jgi:hypothetical protein
MKDDDAILAELEALKTRVDALEAKTGLVKPAAQDVAPAKFVERGVSITYPSERSPIAMPTEPELWRILRIVLNAFPKLRPASNPRYEEEDMAGFFREFCLALAGAAHFRRTEEIDHKHTLSWWANEAMKRIGSTAQDINSAAFLAAVIGSGDIKFTLTDPYGNVAAVGLARSGGRPANEAGWRRVLNGGQLLPPVPGRFGAPSSRPSVTIGAEQ